MKQSQNRSLIYQEIKEQQKTTYFGKY